MTLRSVRFLVPLVFLAGAVGLVAPTGASSAPAAFVVRTDWSKFHFDLANSGDNPYENVLGPGNVGSMVKRWSFATGDEVFSSPAVVNGVVYVGSYDGNLYALNASTGAKVWSFATGDFIESSPAVANGVVCVGSGDYSVYALDASTGAELWSFATGGYVFSSPAVANGVVYVGS